MNAERPRPQNRGLPTRRSRWLGASLVMATMLGAGLAGAWVQTANNADALTEWNTRVIPFTINEAGSSRIDFEAIEAAVAASFAPWAELDCTELSFPYAGPSATTAIGFDVAGPNENLVIFRHERSEWMHEPAALAVTTVSSCESTGSFCDFTGEILDADIEVNEGFFRFTVSPLPAVARFSLRNTMTHEVGHLLGLDHTPVVDATMYADAQPGEIKKEDLHPDDIEGICTIYETIYAETAPPQDDCTAGPGRSTTPGGPLFGLALTVLLGWRMRQSALASAPGRGR